MELKKILVGIDGLKAKGNLDIDVKGLESNSKNIYVYGFGIFECDWSNIRIS